MTTDWTLREEQSDDAEAIADLVQAAFDGAPHSDGTEAAILDGLRRAGALRLSLVAERDGAIVGQVAFSPVTVSPVTVPPVTGDGADRGWLGLGPVAVHPQHQGQGIGGGLIRQGLEQLEAQGAAGCVVLGDPGYYQRFGFRADPGLVLPGPPAEYFQALVLNGPSVTGVVAYHPAFSATD